MRPVLNSRAPLFRIASWFTLGLAAFAIWLVWQNGEQAAGAARADVRTQNHLKLLAAKERLESYFAQVGIALQAISLDDDLRAGSTASRGFIDAVFQANYRHHQLSEVYIIEREFDGRSRPMMTFEMPEGAQPADELHTPEREAAEYEVQRRHIRQFETTPTLVQLISGPLELCIGQRGLVYSTPIRNGERLVGIVAGMIAGDTIERQLIVSGLNSRIVLHAPDGDFSTGADPSPSAQRLTARIEHSGESPWEIDLWFDPEASVAAASWRWSLPVMIAALGGASFYLLRLTPRLLAARREAERGRQREAELAHLARIVTISELSTGLAHELAQPLAAIATLAEASSQRVRRAGRADEPLMQDLESIGEQSRRAGQIVQFLRGFVRRQQEPRQQRQLAELVREVVEVLRADLRRRRIDVTIDAEPEVAAVTIEAVAIEQVLLNLIRNAADAIGDLPAPRRTIHVAVRRLDLQHVACEVTDAGPGAAPETIARMFEPFFTTRRQGLGLGLSISRTIIEAHGGRIHAAAAQPFGMTVSFALPVGRIA